VGFPSSNRTTGDARTASEPAVQPENQPPSSFNYGVIPANQQMNRPLPSRPPCSCPVDAKLPFWRALSWESHYWTCKQSSRRVSHGPETATSPAAALSRRPKGPGARHLPCGPQLPSCGPLGYTGARHSPRWVSDRTGTRPAGASDPAHRQGRWVVPPALIMSHAVRNFPHEGIARAITTVYYQAGRSGNLCPRAVFPGS
jgi:hypothetical protein